MTAPVHGSALRTSSSKDSSEIISALSMNRQRRCCASVTERRDRVSRVRNANNVSDTCKVLLLVHAYVS